MKLWMVTDFPGESSDATALVWADDPAEAQWMLKEKVGKAGRMTIEVQPERGVWGLIGMSSQRPTP